MRVRVGQLATQRGARRLVEAVEGLVEHLVRVRVRVRVRVSLVEHLRAWEEPPAAASAWAQAPRHVPGCFAHVHAH